MKKMKLAKIVGLAIGAVALASASLEAGIQKDRERLLQMEGCFLTDYKFAETKILSEEYSEQEFQKNSLLYDVATVEWIGLVEDEGDRLVFQRIMRIDMGAEQPYTFKHHAEEWTYEPSFVYDYLGGGVYSPRALDEDEALGTWKRDTKALDDGIRYQCVAPWKHPSDPRLKAIWSCDNYAPIPGRETRDRGRKDYQGLDRHTEIQTHDWGWIELQRNSKVREQDTGHLAIASEWGNTTYTRVDDSECTEAKAYWEKRKDFWTIARKVWSDVLDGKQVYASESVLPFRALDRDGNEQIQMRPRYEAINQVAEDFSPGFVLQVKRDLQGRLTIDDSNYHGFFTNDNQAVYDAILGVIDQYRK